MRSTGIVETCRRSTRSGPHSADTASLGTRLFGYSNCASRVRRYTIFTTNSGIPIDEIVYSAVQGYAVSAANVPATHVYLSYARLATKYPASRRVYSYVQFP